MLYVHVDEKRGCCFLETRKKQDKGRQAKARGQEPKKKSEAEKAQSECMSALRSEEEGCGR